MSFSTPCLPDRLSRRSSSAGSRCRGTQAVDPATLRDWLTERLPDYMVPAAFVVLDALPLTPNGKLDRKALPAPEELGRAAGYVAPATPEEILLCDLVAELLGLERRRARRQLLPSRRPLAAGHPAGRTDPRPARTRAAHPHHLRHARARRSGPRAAHAAQGRPAAGCRKSGPRELPLSFAQARLWFLHQLEGANPNYNIPVGVRLQGALDAAALERALVRPPRAAREPAHAARGARRAGRGSTSCRLRRGAARVLAGSAASSEDDFAAAAAHGFDLGARDPVPRDAVPARRRDDHALLLLVHHSAADGWSVAPLLDDLSRRLCGTAAGRGVRRSRRCRCSTPTTRSGSARCSAARTTPRVRWPARSPTGRGQLADLPGRTGAARRPAAAAHADLCGRRSSRIAIPPDVARPAAGSRPRARRHAVHAAAGRARRAAEQARRRRRYPDRRAHRRAAPRPRSTRSSASSSTRWCCAPIPAAIPPSAELLRRARATCLEAYAHQDLPFERLVEILGSAARVRPAAAVPDHAGAAEQPAAASGSAGAARHARCSGARTTKFDLTFTFTERGRARPESSNTAPTCSTRASAERLAARCAACWSRSPPILRRRCTGSNSGAGRAAALLVRVQ